MQLVILPADTAGPCTWQIIYGDKNEDNFCSNAIAICAFDNGIKK